MAFLDEFAMLIEKTIASSSELVKFQRKQSEKINNINSGKQKKERPKKLIVSDPAKNKNLKEIVAEAGDLSHLFLPLIHLGDLDKERKKTNGLLRTFRQGVEFYRKKIGRSSSIAGEAQKAPELVVKPQVRTQSLPSPHRRKELNNNDSPFETADESRRSLISKSPNSLKSCYTNEASKNSGSESPDNKKSSPTAGSLKGITDSIGDLIKVLQSTTRCPTGMKFGGSILSILVMLLINSFF